MRHVPHTIRVLLAAIAAFAAVLVVGSVWSVGSPAKVLAATPTPKPTPCPTDLSGLLCTVGGGPTLPPTPASTPTPTPSPSHTGTPSATPAAGAGAGTGTPTPSPSAAASPTPTVSLSAIAARFANAPFLQSLLNILAHPSAAQQPDLLHFRVPAAAAAPAAITGPGLPLTSPEDPPPPPAPAAPPGHRGWSVVAALLAGLLAAGLVAAWTPGGRALLRRLDERIRRAARFPGTPIARLLLRTARGRRLGAAIAVATCPLIIAAAVAGAVAPPQASQAPGLAAVSAAGAAARSAATDDGVGGRGVAAQSASPAVADALPVWTQLVSVEQGIGEQQDALSRQEADLSRLARVAAVGSADDMLTPPSGRVQLPEVQQRLAALVADHEQTAALLHQSLQAEYTVYRGAAQDPAQKQQLLTGASQAPAPDARQAVADDLGRIETQLAQEKVIADARAQLAKIGSLTQKQLDAIQAHQPFLAPELAPINQLFGPTDFSMEPPLTYGGTFYPHFHTGIDLGAPLGTPIHAAADGVVIVATASVDSAGHFVGYGNYVVIAHPAGFITLYGHLNALSVKTGQFVHQGEIIGEEGTTGWSTGPHLHFEIRLGDQLLDPLPYIKAQLG